MKNAACLHLLDAIVSRIEFVDPISFLGSYSLFLYIVSARQAALTNLEVILYALLPAGQKRTSMNMEGDA